MFKQTIYHYSCLDTFGPWSVFLTRVKGILQTLEGQFVVSKCHLPHKCQTHLIQNNRPTFKSAFVASCSGRCRTRTLRYDTGFTFYPSNEIPSKPVEKSSPLSREEYYDVACMSKESSLLRKIHRSAKFPGVEKGGQRINGLLYSDLWEAKSWQVSTAVVTQNHHFYRWQLH